MAVWITGARGFIGRHVALRLAGKGLTVVGIGHGSWTEDAFRPWGVDAWLNGDLSPANFDFLAQEHGLPEGIVHLAGGSSVGPSFAQPVEDFQRSVVASNRLVDWVRLHSPATPIAMASSAAVYGSAYESAVAENALSAPYSPYGFHKRMAELQFESYASNFGINVAAVRLFSVYGPHLRKQLLWDSCTKLARGISILELGGKGNELRDWLHVEDAAALLEIGLARASTKAPIVNGGTGIATAVRDIARTLCDAWAPGIEVRFSGNTRAGDPYALIANPALAKSWGFVPSVGWAEGVTAYVEWFRRAQGEAAT